MAHPGYVAIGQEETLDPPYTQSHEIVNTNRALAYARAAGITWLSGCDECLDIDRVIPDGGSYGTPDADPAPWWHGQRPDSTDFLGVVGLEFTGVDDSTRTAKVTAAIRGGGVIGATYQKPREMTLRALAIGATDAGLSYGLRWLSEQFIDVGGDPCLGDPLIFFETCPDVTCTEETDRPVGPCWVDIYARLRAGIGPSCPEDWWPSTYAELRVGPPYLRNGEQGDWCDWVGTYRELRDWLPPWDCCSELEVIPHMKQLSRSRVTEGPTILQRPTMTVGALAEIEFVISAADPWVTRPSYIWQNTWVDW